jgi:hypothetical protein
MSKILVLQPNGNYSEYDTKERGFAYKNITKEDYIEICKNRAVQEAEKEVSMASMNNFSSIVHDFFPIRQTIESFVAELKDLGFNRKGGILQSSIGGR